MSGRWLTVLSGGSPSGPPNFLPELAWFDSLDELETQADIKPGTPVIIDLARTASARLDAFIADVAFEDLEPAPGPDFSPIGRRRRK